MTLTSSSSCRPSGRYEEVDGELVRLDSWKQGPKSLLSRGVRDWWSDSVYGYNITCRPSHESRSSKNSNCSQDDLGAKQEAMSGWYEPEREW